MVRVRSQVRFGVVLAGLGVLLGAMPAMSATLTPDMGPLSASQGRLERDGDFDGDGRRDDLQLVAEADDRVAVHVRLNTADGVRDVNVTRIEASANAPMNVQVVKAGSYVSDCGDYAEGCQARIEAMHDSLVFGLSDGVTVLAHWQGDHFEQDFIRQDEAMLAQSLAGLLASNR